MIKNNKGVTLIELLIVIVVMGIIAAFAIPSVGTIIENSREDSIINDALLLDNAAKLHCAQVDCDTNTPTFADLMPYVDGFTVGDGGDYEDESTFSKTSGESEYTFYLAKGDKGYSFGTALAEVNPLVADRDDVSK